MTGVTATELVMSTDFLKEFSSFLNVQYLSVPKRHAKKTVPSGSIPYFVRHANFFHDIFESEVEQIIACNKTI